MGCGRSAGKPELLRIAAIGPEGARRAVLDPRGTLPGRGAYLCRSAEPEVPAAACLERALRRKAIPRALRCAVALDPKLVESVN